MLGKFARTHILGLNYSSDFLDSDSSPGKTQVLLWKTAIEPKNYNVELENTMIAAQHTPIASPCTSHFRLLGSLVNITDRARRRPREMSSLASAHQTSTSFSFPLLLTPYIFPTPALSAVFSKLFPPSSSQIRHQVSTSCSACFCMPSQ